MIYERHITPQVLKALKDTPVIVINGARQTGKSTFCGQLIKKEGIQAQFVTLDDPITLGNAKQNPTLFLERLEKHVVIDEIQRVPELFLGIKMLVDRDRQNRRYILTGSADILTLPKLADSLAGRMEIRALWPLSQGEIQGHRESFLDAVFSNDLPNYKSELSWNDLIEIAATGGYPEAVRREDDDRRIQWFRSYLLAIMERDIRDLANIEGLTALPHLLELLATRIGSLVNFSDISRLAQMPSTTLKRYFSLLQKVFLIVTLPAWTANAEGRLVKSPKIYLNDTGLLCALRQESQSSLRDNRTAAGSILENFVVMEMIKQISWSGPYNRVFHFRSQQEKEVDIVLEGENRKVVGIEVKAASSVTGKEFAGLEALEKLAGNRFNMGIVLYSGKQTFKFGDRMYAVPIDAVWQ